MLCFFSRYEGEREQSEQEVLDNSVCELEVIFRATSGEDFPERNPESKLKLSVFRRV